MAQTKNLLCTGQMRHESICFFPTSSALSTRGQMARLCHTVVKDPPQKIQLAGAGKVERSL